MINEFRIHDWSIPPWLKSVWRQKSRIRIAVLVLFALFLYVYLVPSPRIRQEPVAYARNADGKLVSANDSFEDQTIEFTIDSFHAENESEPGAIGYTTGSPEDRLAADSLVILNRSPGLLSARVGERLLQCILDGGNFQSVEYFPFGRLPETGTKRPDLFLVLEQFSLEESGILTNVTKAGFIASWGRFGSEELTPRSSAGAPPFTRLLQWVTRNHESTQWGLVSSAAKFRRQGESIGDEIGPEVAQRMNELRADHPGCPPLPDSFTPGYQPHVASQFLRDFGFAQISSTHGPFYRNETLWVAGDIEPNELFSVAYQELITRGWRGLAPQESTTQLNMVRGTESLVLYPWPNDNVVASAPQQMHARYSQRMNQNDVQSAIGEMLTEPQPDLSVLAWLAGRASETQKEILAGLLEEDPPKTTSSWLFLADHFLRQKQTERAIVAVRCARVLNQLWNEDLDSTIEELARTSGVQGHNSPLITADVLKTLGIGIVSQDAPILNVTLGPDRSAAVAVRESNGRWQVRAVRFGTRGRSDSEVECETSLLMEDGGGVYSKSKFGDPHLFGMPSTPEVHITTRAECEGNSVVPSTMTFELVTSGM